MDHELRFARATRRRLPWPLLATFGLVLLLAAGFLVDVGRGPSVRSTAGSGLVT